jgi:hypothetical protein
MPGGVHSASSGSGIRRKANRKYYFRDMPDNENDRIFAIARSLLNSEKYLAILQFRDDGSLISDHQLLLYLRDVVCAGCATIGGLDEGTNGKQGSIFPTKEDHFRRSTDHLLLRHKR